MSASEVRRFINSLPDNRAALQLLGALDQLIPTNKDTALTAHAGGGQSSALALRSDCAFHDVTTVATAADSVALPYPHAGDMHFVKNSAALSMQVYAVTPGTIDSTATGTGVAQLAGDGVLYLCVVDGNYIRMGGVSSTEVFGTITAEAITGSDSSLGITGQAAAQGGAVVVTGGASSTGGNAGGAARVVGGAGGATGIGGAAELTGAAGQGGAVGGAATVTAGAGQGTGNGAIASVTGGASGAGATGTGGVAKLVGGAAASTNGAGGAAQVTGGAGIGNLAGGAATIAGGAGGATGAGGAVTVTSGAGGATSGVSGDLTIATGTTTAGSGSATGAVIVQSGAGAASAAAVAGGASGAVTLRSQDGGANTGGASGQVGGAAGAVAITGGAGGATNSAGAHAGGAGADVALTAGAGGNASAGTGNGGAGGSVILTPGAGGTSAGGTAGVAGGVFLRSSGGNLFRQQTVALDIVDTAPTLTVAQFINGIVFGQPTTGRSVTTPTGAALSTACGPDLAVGDSFDFTLIVDGSVGADDIYTLTAGDGNVTLKGVATLGPIVASTSPGCATWTFRNTGANTWVGYRKS